MPQRSVRLSAEGELPTTPLSPSQGLGARLEGIMANFLEQTQARQEPAASNLSKEMQEQLGALGYLE
jgi:hypothetical protein